MFYSICSLFLSRVLTYNSTAVRWRCRFVLVLAFSELVREQDAVPAEKQSMPACFVGAWLRALVRVMLGVGLPAGHHRNYVGAARRPQGLNGCLTDEFSLSYLCHALAPLRFSRATTCVKVGLPRRGPRVRIDR